MNAEGAAPYVGRIVHRDTSLGTGFVIHPEVIATCAHVLRDFSEDLAFAPLQSDTRYPLTVLATDQDRDLALLSLPDSSGEAIGPLVSGLSAPPNQPFSLIGFGEDPKLQQFRYFSATGTVIGPTERIPGGHTDGLTLIQVVPTAILPGMSGAPLVCPGIGVFGILSERFRSDTELHGQALVIPIDYLISLDPGRRLSTIGWLADRSIETALDEATMPLADLGSEGAIQTLEILLENGDPEAHEQLVSILSTRHDISTSPDSLSRQLDNLSFRFLGLRFGTITRQIERAAQKPETELSGLDLEDDLIAIPGGTFQMGTDDFESEAFPRTPIEVSAFFLSKYPVTNYQYWLFTHDTNWPAPAHWRGPKPPRHIWNHPVVMVNWPSAVYFCYWLWRRTNWRWRLPTEAEWEFAARGQDGRTFPWGMEFDPGHCNTAEASLNSPSDVDRYVGKGDSPFGVSDMAGNVWEWTSSLWSTYPYDDSVKVKLPPLPFLMFTEDWWKIDRRVPQDHNHWLDRIHIAMRGGSWGGDARYATTYSRIWSSAGNKGAYGGFRLAVSAVEQRTAGGDFHRLDWSPYVGSKQQEFAGVGETLSDDEMVMVAASSCGASSYARRGDIDADAWAHWYERHV